ncbi:MAG: nuclear transport factor 2 family protein [Pseudomonadota bacterium]
MNISENTRVTHADIVARGWDAVAKGDWDTLVADYADDMIFVMPGQQDTLNGRAAFRDALDNFGTALPPGLEITGLRFVGESDEVVTLIDWKSDKIPDGSHAAVLFRFEGDLIVEERWFVDTEEWKSAF